MENKEQFTEKEIEHLKEHQEILKQMQGKDIMQNFFVKNPNERRGSFRDALVNLRDEKQEMMDDDESPVRIREIGRRDVAIIDDFLQYFGDKNELRSMRGLDIPKIREKAEEHTALILDALTQLVKDYEKSIEKWPKTEKEIKEIISDIEHTKLDFKILLKIRFFTRSYLENLKKDIGI